MAQMLGVNGQCIGVLHLLHMEDKAIRWIEMGAKSIREVDKILEGINILMATSKHLSATKAAQELDITPGTALRKLSDMESALGTRLFDRSHAGLLPTSALNLLLPMIANIQSAAIQLKTEADAFDLAVEGCVKIAAPPGFCTYMLTSQIANFHAHYPKIILDIVAGGELADLAMREADICLRCNEPTSGDVIFRRLLNFDLAMVCSPGLAQRVKARTAADFPWIINSDEMSNLTLSMTDFLRKLIPDLNVVLYSADMDTLLQAAKAGVGAMICAKPLAEAVGGLVSLPVPLPPMPSTPLFIVTNRALRQVHRVAIVWDWLEGIFAGTTFPQVAGLRQPSTPPTSRALGLSPPSGRSAPATGLPGFSIPG